MINRNERAVERSEAVVWLFCCDVIGDTFFVQCVRLQLCRLMGRDGSLQSMVSQLDGVSLSPSHPLFKEVRLFLLIRALKNPFRSTN
jgi:hypothetical protein